MDFVIVLVAPLVLVIGIPIGLIQLFTAFGILFALPSLVLVIGVFIVSKYQKTKVALLLALTATLGQWLSFLSWISSRQSINAGEATRQWGMDVLSVAKAGFPISALELPPSPMGSNNVPVDMWGGVFANQLIWFLVAFAIAMFIVSRKRISSGKKVLLTCALLALLAVVDNLALFMLWYD